MYLKEFSQLIVILYRDEGSGKHYPGLFALINNKKQEGYKYLFKKILDILTLENTSNIKLLSYTINFEKGLINLLCSHIFPLWIIFSYYLFLIDSIKG